MDNAYPDLAQCPQVTGVIYQILAPAIAAGLPEEQAEAIYQQLRQHYARLPTATRSTSLVW